MESNARDRWLATNYAATIFTSAFLLFQIQPLISKFILPWFGGTPAVWTTCLLFFQTLLFAGYAYAHLLHSRCSVRQQAVIHIGLLAVAIAMLGVLPGERWQPHSYQDPVRQILIILTISVGLPFFVLSATGPLLQAWYARSFPGRLPYRLYALSNLGSLLALLSYPFVFERAFALPRQAVLWSVGFVLYALLCTYAAWRLWTSAGSASNRSAKAQRKPSSSAAGQPPAPRWYQRLAWLLWPALASVVLLATTNHISVDIAAVPFLWVVPLALYLLTFIIAFDRPAWYPRAPVAVLVLLAIYAAAVVQQFGVGRNIDRDELRFTGTSGLFVSFLVDPSSEFHVATWQFLVANLVAMFAICMLCHGELVRQRPHPNYLTSFYLMIAAGGALGGVFVTLVAPQFFVTYLEWQLSLALAFLIAIVFVLKALVDFVFRDDDTQSRRPLDYALLAGLVLAVFLPAAVMLLDLSEFLQSSVADVRLRTRNFFGTLSIQERDSDKPLSHHFLLRHGAITHGAQFAHPNRRQEALTYYARTSGVARAIDYYRRKLQTGRMKLGVVGLGTGSLAAYADGGDSIAFYEINPAVIDIAESGRWFSYLHDCRQRGAQCEIRLGDARLILRRELDISSPPSSPSTPPSLDGEGWLPTQSEHQPHPTGNQYHVLVLDAFSGDAIPVHLLSVEAFQLYLSHLATAAEPAPGAPVSANTINEHGAIAVHISNRYLNLEPVVRAIAQHYGLHSQLVENEDVKEQLIYSADWVILTRNAQLAQELAHFAREPDSAAATAVLWTDNHSSLFDVLQ